MAKRLIYLRINCTDTPDLRIDNTEHSVPMDIQSDDQASDTKLLSQRRLKLENLELWIDGIAALTTVEWYLTFASPTWTRFIKTITSSITVDATDATKGYINYDFSDYDINLDEIERAIDLINDEDESLRFVHKGDANDNADAYGFLVLSLEV